MSMISVEAFYEINLRGKSEQDIQKVIRDLKAEIASLKEKMKVPNKVLDEYLNPNRSVILSMDKQYLKRAEQALLEARAMYPKPKG